MDTVPGRSGRAGQLDALRALAVTAVVFTHSIPQDLELGDYGVHLFFVISGYLITGQLLAMRAQGARQDIGLPRLFGVFYGRRAIRLMPAYYMTIFVAAAIDLRGMRQELPWHAAQASNLMFALHPAMGDTSSAGHFWSLSVEEQFYLLWPLVIFLTPPRWTPAAAVLVVLLGVYAWWPDNSLPNAVKLVGFVDSLDSLGIGALLAFLQARGAVVAWLGRWGWAAAVLCGGLITGKALWPEAWPDNFDMLLHEVMIVAFAALVFHAAKGVGGWGGAVLNLAPLQYLGQISYGIYLFHPFVHAVYWKVTEHFDWPSLNYGVWLFVLVFAATVLCASLSWKLFEAPLARFKPSLSARRPPAAEVPAEGQA